MATHNTSRLTIDDFAEAFGILPVDLPDDCKSQVSRFDFRYEFVDAAEHNNLVNEIQQALDDGRHSRVGSHRRDLWERAWSENLARLISSDYDLVSLVPNYYLKWQPLRFKHRFIKTAQPMFQLNFFTVLRTWLFKHYLTDIDNVYELGSGSAQNLAMLAQMLPEKNFFGLDWAPASQQLLTTLSTKFGWNMVGRQFDLFAPDHKFQIAENSAVFTIAALEQLGNKCRPILEYLLEQAPRLCISLEPLVELYNEEDQLDRLAIQFHKKRGYLENYLTSLQELELEQRLKITRIHRMHFGAFYDESYTLVVWELTSA